MTTPGLWFRFHVNAHENPKVLRLRALAERNADAACWGWFGVVLAGAKRSGSWTFADDAHLDYIAGRYARFIPLYREVGLLDGLTIHDGEDYNTPKDPTAAERMRRHRSERNDRNSVTPRAEQSRTEQEQSTLARAQDDDPASTYWALTGKFPTEKSLPWIDQMAALYGSPAVNRVLATEHIADRAAATLLGRVQNRLRSEARELDRAERTAEQARLQEKRSKPKVLEPWQEEFRRRIQEQYEGAA